MCGDGGAPKMDREPNQLLKECGWHAVQNEHQRNLIDIKEQGAFRDKSGPRKERISNTHVLYGDREGLEQLHN